MSCTINNVNIFSSLKPEHKEAIGLLSIGTFLEYFDLMLYVHMAVLLNELFFPKTDPYMAGFISAIAFCSTYVFRPFGALLFGYIGDNMGRKATVVITTFIMAICCLIMANLPTYAQVGIYASWGITACRILQGISSMGEIIGAQIYLSELIKRPASYPAVCLILCASNLGAFVALAIATIVLNFNMGWRIVFWIGAGIAAIGFVARTALRETPEFVDAKRRIKTKYEKANFSPEKLKQTIKQDPIVNQKVNRKTSLAYFFIKCARPLCFYFTYIYCSNILKNSFHYTSEQVIQHNLVVAIIDFLITIGLTYLSCKIYPLIIVKTKAAIFSIGVLFGPYILSQISTPLHMFFIQMFVCLFYIGAAPADAILFGYFPIFKRFTYSSFIHALSRTLTYIVTSFGLVYLTNQFNYWGLLIIFIPVTIGFIFGIIHFEKLEKEAGNYPQKLPNALVASGH